MSSNNLVPASEKKRTIADLLTSPAMKQQIALALPRHLTPDRFTRLMLTQLRTVKNLANCTETSLLGSMMTAAQLGLEIGVQGQCWILPFKNKQGDFDAQLLIGYRGLVTLGWRSNMVASIAARAVYDGDDFSYDFGRDLIQHIPKDNKDPDKITHFWASVGTTTGGRVWDVMTKKEVDLVRARSRAGSSGPWVTDYPEMGKKTVLRRVMKFAPCSTEMMHAMEIDDATTLGNSIDLNLPLPADAEILSNDESGGKE